MDNSEKLSLFRNGESDGIGLRDVSVNVSKKYSMMLLESGRTDSLQDNNATNRSFCWLAGWRCRGFFSSIFTSDKADHDIGILGLCAC